MIQQRLSHHISAIRRIQTRLGTHPKADQGNTNLLGEQARSNLLATLSPNFKLCDFHPFSPQAQFDFDLFEATAAPGESVQLPAQKNPLAEKQNHGGSSGVGGDADADSSAYSFYRHISKLVIETEQVIAHATDPAGSADYGHNGLAGDKGSNSLYKTGSSKAKHASEQNRPLRNADTSLPLPGLVASETSAPHKIKRNDHLKSSVPTQKTATQDITVFQKIVENLHYLEHCASKQTAKTQPPVSEAMTGNSGKTMGTILSSQTRLRTLTQSLLGEGEQTNSETTDLVAGSGLQNPSNTGPRGPVQAKKKGQELSDNDNQKNNVPAADKLAIKPRGSVPQDQPEHTLRSLLPADNRSDARGTEQSSAHSFKSGVYFQDIGRLEALKVADALSDYLQEQAGLHGVDLS